MFFLKTYSFLHQKSLHFHLLLLLMFVPKLNNFCLALVFALAGLHFYICVHITSKSVPYFSYYNSTKLNQVGLIWAQKSFQFEGGRGGPWSAIQHMNYQQYFCFVFPQHTKMTDMYIIHGQLSTYQT